MLTMLGIPNCDTIRKARRFLQDQGVDYRFRDLRKQPLTHEEWLVLAKADADGKLVNTRGPSFRKSGRNKEELGEPTAVASLLNEFPTAMKRPVLLRDGKLISIGFNADIYTELIA